jgi:hypothetical protein
MWRPFDLPDGHTNILKLSPAHLAKSLFHGLPSRCPDSGEFTQFIAGSVPILDNGPDVMTDHLPRLLWEVDKFHPRMVDQGLLSIRLYLCSVDYRAGYATLQAQSLSTQVEVQ